MQRFTTSTQGHASLHRFAGTVVLLAVLAASTACDEKDDTVPDPRAAGETDGEAEGTGGDTDGSYGDTDTDGAEPECVGGEAAPCGALGALQFCNTETQTWCACLPPNWIACEPGTVREKPCFEGDDFGATYTETCQVVGCEPTWVSDFDDVCLGGGTTPLVLVPQGRSPNLLPAGSSTFALAGSSCESTDWPTADTPWIVRDVNGNGRIDDGSELFGSSTVLPSGRTARHGFEALAPLDANRDGRIDAADPGFAELLLWADADADRRSSPDELLPLAEAGITAIPLSYRRVATCDDRGNCGYERTAVVGRPATVVDLHLRCR